MSESLVGFLQTVLAFVLVLAPLVFVHELGHFLVAKAFGIGAPVFSLGFGPRLFGLRRAGTDYRVSAIPLGGYVRLAGDEADEQRTGAPEEFLTRPKYQRFLVFIAGAGANILTAFLAFWLWFAIYGKSETPRTYPVVHSIESGSPAEHAGIQAGDRLIAIDGRDLEDPETAVEALQMDILLAPGGTKTITLDRSGESVTASIVVGTEPRDGSGYVGWQLAPGGPTVVVGLVPGAPAESGGLKLGDRILGAEGREPIPYLDLRMLLLKSAGRPVALRVQRDEAIVDLSVIPREEGGGGKIGAELSPAIPIHKDLTVVEAAGESVRMNLQLSKTLMVVLKRLVSRELPLRTMSGPIGIAQYARQALVAGFDTFLWLLGFFSLQLGILNLLPIPVLDGGHILILFVEGVLRRDLSDRVKERVMQVGFVFLLAFMSIVVYMDIRKIF